MLLWAESQSSPFTLTTRAGGRTKRVRWKRSKTFATELHLTSNGDYLSFQAGTTHPNTVTHVSSNCTSARIESPCVKKGSIWAGEGGDWGGCFVTRPAIPYLGGERSSAINPDTHKNQSQSQLGTILQRTFEIALSVLIYLSLVGIQRIYEQRVARTCVQHISHRYFW